MNDELFMMNDEQAKEELEEIQNEDFQDLKVEITEISGTPS